MGFWKRLFGVKEVKESEFPYSVFYAFPESQRPEEQQVKVKSERHRVREENAKKIAKRFFDEKLVLDPNSILKRTNLNTAWKQWKQEYHFLFTCEHALESNCANLILGLNNILPIKLIAEKRQRKGKLERIYRGIRLK